MYGSTSEGSLSDLFFPTRTEAVDLVLTSSGLDNRNKDGILHSRCMCFFTSVLIVAYTEISGHYALLAGRETSDRSIWTRASCSLSGSAGPRIPAFGI